MLSEKVFRLVADIHGNNDQFLSGEMLARLPPSLKKLTSQNQSVKTAINIYETDSAQTSG